MSSILILPPQKQTRILLFYVFGALVVGMLVPYDEPRLLGGTGNATSSPFVIAINNAGIKILPDIINAFILISAYSAASSQVCKSIHLILILFFFRLPYPTYLTHLMFISQVFFFFFHLTNSSFLFFFKNNNNNKKPPTVMRSLTDRWI